jgi:hypothetical protein
MSKWILYLIFVQSINDFTKRASVYIHDMCLIQIVSTNFILEGLVRIKRPPYTVTPLEKERTYYQSPIHYQVYNTIIFRNFY